MSSGERSLDDHVRGTLGEVPIAHALVYLRAKRLSGVLELRALGGRHAWLAFTRGVVTSIQTTPTIARFGTVVYELGLIDAETLDTTTIASAREQRAHADILCERGAISAADRERVVREQMRRRIHHLFQLPPTTVFTFREARPSLAEPPLTVDVLGPVWRGLVDFPPLRRVDEVLEIVGQRPLTMVSEAVLHESELGEGEIAALEQLTAPGGRTLDEVRRVTTLDPRRLDLVLYFALVSRSVEPLGEGPRPAASREMWAVQEEEAGEHPTIETPSQRPPVQVSVSSARLVADLARPHEMSVEAIRARAARIDREGLYEALGLVEGATLDAVRAAYFRLSRAWNPERLPPELEDAREAVAIVYEHMTEAHRVLTEEALARQLREKRPAAKQAKKP